MKKMASIFGFVFGYVLSAVIFLIDWFTGYHAHESNEPPKTLAELFNSLLNSPLHTTSQPILMGTILGVVFAILFRKIVYRNK